MSNVCIFTIVDDYNADYWTLGTTFFKDYYASFKVSGTEDTIDFGPNDLSDAKRDMFVEFPTREESEVLWELTWVYD
jgi:hypothetical protein